MTRVELERYIDETYNGEKNCPWTKHPDYVVYRHGNNQKWFALVMDIPKVKLGLHGGGVLTVVNLKCDPVLIGSLRAESGFFPAYHMNKERWITVALDGSAPDDMIKTLLDMSFEATAVKAKKRRISTDQ